jgi:hypothetical protein
MKSPRFSSTHLSDPPGRTKVVVQEKTGSRLRTTGEPARDKRHPHPVLPHRSPSFILSHLSREGRVLKRHGEGACESELAADFTSLVPAKTLSSM